MEMERGLVTGGYAGEQAEGRSGTPGKKSRSEQLPGRSQPASETAAPEGAPAPAGDPDAAYSVHLAAAPVQRKAVGSGGATPVVQRKAADFETRDGEIALQRILETGTLEAVTKTLAALKRARADRSTDDPDPTTERKELPTEPDVVDLDAGGIVSTFLVSPRSTDAMIRTLTTRLAEMLGMQPDPKWLAFAKAFNREFATVLNAFDLVDEAKDGQRNEVAAIRLQYLFTPVQRDLLMGFFDDNVIPEGLFNADEIGRTTAQQRILMSGHILATGKYSPGSFDQQVHALACFHWVRIVHHYAGATSRGLNKGLTGNFDHAGNAVLATGKTDEILHATEDDSLEVPEGSYQDQKHGDNAYRFGIASWDTVMSLEPGDWLYIYNANSSISGAHSIIFGGWEAPPGNDGPGRDYREARVFDQGRPKDGGESHTTLLGSDIFMLGKRAVKPVSQITRMNPDAAPADTVDALTPDITGTVNGMNKDFIRKLGWKKGMKSKMFDAREMNAWLKAENAKLIGILFSDGRLSEKQRELLDEANATDDNHTLVCLYQRVLQMAANSDALERNDDKTYGEKDAQHEKAEADQAARTAEIMGEVAPLQLEVTGIELSLVPLEWQLDTVDLGDDLKEAYAEWRRLRKERKALPKSDEAGRAALRSEEEKVQDRIAEMTEHQKDHKKDIKELKRTIKSLSADERRLEAKITAKLAKLAKDDPTAEIFGLVHGGSRKGTVNEKINGAYADIVGKVPWETFMIEKPATE
jgi:hypothetical protein